MNFQTISPIPRLVASFYKGSKDVEQEVRTTLKGFDEETILQVVDAVRQNTFKLLPDGFQGGRVLDNSDIFVLYTTRKQKV